MRGVKRIAAALLAALLVLSLAACCTIRRISAQSIRALAVATPSPAYW